MLVAEVAGYQHSMRTRDYKIQGKATPRLLPRSGVFDLEADLVGSVVHVVHGHHALDLQIPGPARIKKEVQYNLDIMCAKVIRHTNRSHVLSKLRTALGKFGEFWALIAYFWLAWVRRNHFVNTISQNLARRLRTLHITLIQTPH